MASTLYCGDCCINKLIDDDVNQCDCCQCIRVPNEEMLKREAAEEDDEDEDEEVVCFKCNRGEKECQENTDSENNPITSWIGLTELLCDDCYYEHYASDDEGDNVEEYDTAHEEDGWNAIYGFEHSKTRTFIMAGGGIHWWHYVVEFDSNCEQTAVYIESKDGRLLQYKQRLAYRINDDNVEQLRLVNEDWVPNRDANEDFIVCICDC